VEYWGLFGLDGEASFSPVDHLVFRCLAAGHHFLFDLEIFTGQVVVESGHLGAVDHQVDGCRYRHYGREGERPDAAGFSQDRGYDCGASDNAYNGVEFAEPIIVRAPAVMVSDGPAHAEQQIVKPVFQGLVWHCASF